ncbi:hypothetical protein [uncultured Sulfitobacter sp.]|uniref:hypothetical protein n=1 Tax=uncultured Sulfitobacter sp. TaxID=191468 RepID=UPI00260265C0|nr:hypothetical protein [uncultured Sulfitobacter sp.]
MKNDTVSNNAATTQSTCRETAALMRQSCRQSEFVIQQSAQMIENGQAAIESSLQVLSRCQSEAG